MKTTDAIIEITGVTKVYGSNGTAVHALRGIDMPVRAGEFVALIGPSGSGKSTLMAILGCLDSPTAGSYLSTGSRSKASPGRELAAIRNEKIGFVFQSYNLLPKASVVRNVELPMLYAGVGRRERRRRALELLEKRRHSRQGEGQLPAVAFGRPAPARRDRPLARESSRDAPRGRADRSARLAALATKSWSCSRDLHRQGNTVVLVTHDPTIAALAQRRVEIHDGGRVGPAEAAA